MRLKEVFTVPEKEKVKNLKSFGAIGFGKAITGAHDEVTPHYEMRQCLQMFEQNPIVNSALSQYIMFLFPNKEIKIHSSDKRTKKFLEDWHKMRTQLLEEYRNLLLVNKMTGNGYLEGKYIKMKGEIILDNLSNVNDVGRIWININGEDSEYYIYELPVGIKSIYYNGEYRTPKFYTVQYMKNYVFQLQRIYGISLPKDQIKHYKTGWSRDGIYGRSQMASAIDADIILRNILSSWNAISLGRNVDRKLISISDNASDINVDQDRLTQLEDKLANTDDPYILFNIPLKFVQTDVSSQGKYDLMEGVVDMLRRMIMMSLLPQHLTSWSDSNTTQGSKESMPSFRLRLKAEQNSFINFLNNAVIGELRKTYPWLAPDATFVLDEPMVTDNESYINIVEKLLQMGTIDQNTAQQYLNKLNIIDVPVKKEVQPSEFKESMNTEYSKNIGGKKLHIDEEKDSYKIMLDKKILSILKKDGVKKNSLKQIFDNYASEIENQQQVFGKPSLEDEIADEYSQLILDEFNDRLDKLFKTIDRKEVKREGFLSDTILKATDDIFKGFNGILKSLSQKGLDEEIKNIDEVDDTPVSDNVKELIRDKRQLIKQQVGDQIVNTKDNVLLDIKRLLRDGLASGKSFKDIKKQLNDDFKKDDGVEWKFKRTMGTELKRATTLLKLKKWKEMGFSRYEWITMEDEKVRESHRNKNKRVFSIDDALSSDSMDRYPGYDYNCRCFARLYD